MIVRRRFWVASFVICLLCVACSSTPAAEPTSVPAATTAPAPSATTAPISSDANSAFSIENCGRTLTFDKAPERVVSLSQPSTELLLALGLRDKVVALAGSYTDYPEAYKTQVAGIKQIGSTTALPTKNALLAEQPDFVIADQLDQAFDSAMGYASVPDLEAAGAQVYASGACTTADQSQVTIDSVYTNLAYLGQIFGVSDQADKLIDQLKTRQSAVVEGAIGRPKIKVAFYAGGEGPLNVLAGGLWDDLISQAGGENVFKPDQLHVSIDEFVSAQPTVILVNSSTPQQADTLLAFFKQTFSMVPAVQHNQLVIIPTINTAVGVRVIDGLEQIADALHADSAADATGDYIAAPFAVSVAQFQLDSAGFHGMAEVLSDTKTIDTAYISTVTRLNKVLHQTTWPSELNDQAQAFMAALDTFTAALKDNNVEAAVSSSVVVHDAQHEFSHAIDAWLATNPAKASTAQPFDVSVAQLYLDSAGFHGMAEVLSDTKIIDTAYISTVTRLNKVLHQTTWPSELNDQAQAFMAALDIFTAALKDNNVEAAVSSSAVVHDAQHEFSHAIDAWLATNPAKASTAQPFDVSVAQLYLDSAGFHGMAEVLSDTKTIDTAYISTVTRLNKVLHQTTWPSELNDQAQAFMAALDTFTAALKDNNVEAAVSSSAVVHDAQHEFSHAIDAWLSGSSSH